MLAAQLFQAGDASGGARATRFHTLANPNLLLREHFVKLRIHHLFHRQLIGLLRDISFKITGIAAQNAAIQLHDAGADGVQKCPVMADRDDCAIEILQKLLQPNDAAQIQMVGRLIE